MKHTQISNVHISSTAELEQYLEDTIKSFSHTQNIVFDDIITSISSTVSYTEVLDELLYRKELLHKPSNLITKSNLKNLKILHTPKPSLIRRFSQKIDYQLFKFKHSIPSNLRALFSSNDDISQEFLQDKIDTELLQLQSLVSSLEFKLLNFETALFSLKNVLKHLNVPISHSLLEKIVISHSKRLKKKYSELDKRINTYITYFSNVSEISNISFEKIYEEYHTIKLETMRLKESSFKEVIHLESSLFEFFEHSNRLDEEIHSLPKIKLQELKKGDVLVEYIEQEYPKMLGRVISFFLKSPIIHTSIVYKTTKNHVFVFETSTLNGIFKSKILEFKPEKGIQYIISRANTDLNIEQLHSMDSFIDSHISTPYAPLKTTGLVYKKLVKGVKSKYYFTNPNLKNPISHKKGLFCSELVSRMYKEMGITITKIADDSLVSPFDVYNSKVLAKIGVLGK